MKRNHFRPGTLRFVETPADEATGAGTEPAAGDSTETPAEKPADETPADGEKPEGDAEADDVKALPDWAQSEIRRLRTEAASRRVKERELEEKLSAAKTPEEFEAAVNTLREENAALARTSTIDRLTASLGLSADAVELLEGVPTENLEDRAKKIAALAGVAPTTSTRTPSGGLTPSADDEAFDPVATARKARASRR